MSLNQSCPREALMFLSGGLAAAVLEKKGRSHCPRPCRRLLVVETAGIEPTTSALQTLRSPCC